MIRHFFTTYIRKTIAGFLASSFVIGLFLISVPNIARAVDDFTGVTGSNGSVVQGTQAQTGGLTQEQIDADRANRNALESNDLGGGNATAASVVNPDVSGKQQKNGGATDTGLLASIGKRIVAAIGELFLNVAAATVYVGGLALEYSLRLTVFEAGLWFHDSQQLGMAIGDLWRVVRDICNLAFIFGFIYVGIRTIIDPDSADPKKFLSRLIIGALLINFSLFFVKIIIDFANFTAVQVYNALVGGNGDISSKIADTLGISGFYKTVSPEWLAKITGGGSAWFFILASIFLFVAAFVFLASAALLIIRFIALIFIMIFSPVLFAGTVFEQTQSYASDLWHKLIHYAFFAPAYLLLVLISIRIIESLGLKVAGNGMTNALLDPNAQLNSYNIILNFIIAIAALVAALVIAQKMGVKGGDMAISVGHTIRQSGQRFLGASTSGLVARGGRATVGRWGHDLSESDGLRETASKRGFTAWAARQTLRGARLAGDSSFDARNVAGVGEKIGIGAGRKGGFKTTGEEIEKKEKEFAQSLGEVGDDDVRVQARKKEWESAQRTQKAETTMLREQQKKLDKDDKKGRAEIQGKIDKLEKDAKDAQIKYESEKQRRIIGSTFAIEESSQQLQDAVAAREVLLKQRKDEIKALWEGGSYSGANGVTVTIKDSYANLSKDDQKKRRDYIEEITEKLDDLKKEHRAFLNKQKNQGYASVLESSNIITAWPIGRLARHEKDSGEAIRKSAEKGLPKKKDD